MFKRSLLQINIAFKILDFYSKKIKYNAARESFGNGGKKK